MSNRIALNSIGRAVAELEKNICGLDPEDEKLCRAAYSLLRVGLLWRNNLDLVEPFRPRLKKKGRGDWTVESVRRRLKDDFRAALTAIK